MAFHCTIAFLYTVFDFKTRASAKPTSHEHVLAVLVCKIDSGVWNKEYRIKVGSASGMEKYHMDIWMLEWET